jgi:hypothetical protein
MREQEAKQAEISTLSELTILDANADQVIGEQINSFAAGGVELTGGPAAFIESQLGVLAKERENILMTGEFKKGMLLQEAFSLRRSGKDIRSGAFLNALTGAVGQGASFAIASGGTPKGPATQI